MFRTPRRFAASVAWSWALTIPFWHSPPAARSADGPTDPAVIRASLDAKEQRVPARGERRGPTIKGQSGAGWWFVPVGITAALAVFGGISLASKRFGLNLGLPGDSGPLRVVGQARLSPKQSVYLVRVGDRVLILGTGPQGAPTPLGEVTDPAELARLIPGRTIRANLPTTTFDRRIGGDE